MKKLEEYYNPDTTLKDDYQTLCDPKLSLETHTEEVNELILNLVLKYIKEYLEISEDNILDIRKRVSEVFDNLFIKQNPEKNRQELMEEVLEGVFGDNDGFSLQCLSDIQPTASIFKEITFNESFSKQEPFISVDLGSGSGILLLATTIAAQRKKIKNIVGLGFEEKAEAVSNSNRVLGKILPSEQYKIMKENILDPNLYRAWEDLPIKYWVSETISESIPPINLNGSTMSVRMSQRQEKVMPINDVLDPFIHVLQNSVEHVPNFIEKVQQGKIAMFPDIARGLYRPNNEKSTLQLKTRDNKHLWLHEIGEELKDYEDLDCGNRWSDCKDIEDFTGNMLQDIMKKIFELKAQ